MTFYGSFVATLIVFKCIALCVFLAPYAVHRVRGRTRCRRGAGSATTPTLPLQSPTSKFDWSGAIRGGFMVLFMAYPAVSLKIFSLFRCTEIEGVWYLAKDMRLVCYTSQWSALAFYAVVMIIVYVLGLPLAISVILIRHRKHLHAHSDKGTATRHMFGFLYLPYKGADYWEVEELIRRLFLSALVILFDAQSAAPVALAVLVSAWAHVLHSVFKPWGKGSVLYILQHGSLFVTTFVFLMGLLFKADSVTKYSKLASSLAGLMVFLCVAFMIGWVVAVILSAQKLRRLFLQTLVQKGRRQTSLSKLIHGQPAPGSDTHGSNSLDGSGQAQVSRRRSVTLITNPLVAHPVQAHIPNVPASSEPPATTPSVGPPIRDMSDRRVTLPRPAAPAATIATTTAVAASPPQ